MMSNWPAGDEYRRASRRQEGGEHYNLPIQPIRYITANGLDYLSGNVIKYATRHKAKGGAEDIRKAIHCCQLILEIEYGEGADDA